MDYRETYGGEVRNPKWRAQFIGKTKDAPLKLDQGHQEHQRRHAFIASHHGRCAPTCSHFMKSHCVELRRARPFLGTIVDIQARAPNDFTVMRGIEDAFDAVARVHRLMSFHDPESDVSRLNRDAHRQSVTVDKWTWDVLRAAQKFSDESNGAFDVTDRPFAGALEFSSRAQMRVIPSPERFRGEGPHEPPRAFKLVRSLASLGMTSRAGATSFWKKITPFAFVVP